MADEWEYVMYGKVSEATHGGEVGPRGRERGARR